MKGEQLMPIFVYAVVFTIFFASFRINKNENVLDKQSSNSIKGLFIILIVLVHTVGRWGWFPYKGTMVDELRAFHSIVGQLVVAPFFFVSGYGIICSIENKNNGEQYRKTIVTNKFLRIIIYSIICLIPYFIYCACLKQEHLVSDYFLAPIGLASFGNENWFIFAILICYFLSAIVYFINWKKRWIPLVIMFVLIAVYITIQGIWNTSNSHEYDTIICFPLGMLIATYRQPIFRLLKNRIIAVLVLAISLSLIIVLRWLTEYRGAPYLALMIICDALLCIMFTALTRIFTIQSKVLNYCSTCSFGIFFMHRLSLQFYKQVWRPENDNFNYFIVIVTAFALGFMFHYICKYSGKLLVDPFVKINYKIVDQKDK